MCRNRVKIAFSPEFLASLVVSGRSPDPHRTVALGLPGPVNLVECDLQEFRGGSLLFLTFEGANLPAPEDSPIPGVIIYEPPTEGPGESSA